MNAGLLFFLSILYLASLFLIAKWSENNTRIQNGKTNSWMYALSLAVYCSAWTFYGSVGRASTHGMDFLAIYLGPVIAMPVWFLLTKKMIRIVRAQHISSLADFLASRYGKNRSIGTWVAVMIIIAITPYIALQLKAIGDTFYFLTGPGMPKYMSPVLITTVVLCLFTLSYGTRFLDGSKYKTGMVTVVAFESLLKLFIFLGVGSAVVFGLLKKPENVFSATVASNVNLNLTDGAGTDWFWMIILSSISFIFLPRQFQMSVLENRNESHLRLAMWKVPLYLLLITILVIPIALVGTSVLGDSVNPDFYLLGLAQSQGGTVLSTAVFFGGFAASTSMIIVSALSMGTMMNNNIILPTILRIDPKVDMNTRIYYTRRLSLILIFVIAYAYYILLAYDKPLVSTGLTSFAGISQLAPAFVAALFWKGATRKGALAGMLVGFAVWMYLLILPPLLSHQGIDTIAMEKVWYSPIGLPKILGLSQLSATAFISLFFNVFILIGVSLFTRADQTEVNQAEIFTRIDRISRRTYDQAQMWKAEVPFTSIKSLLINFLGDRRTEEVLDRYARINRINFEHTVNADPRMISYAERLLTEAIGPASAKIVIQSVAQGEELSVVEVLDILQESKETFQLNRDLKAKTHELEIASIKLQKANRRLQEYAEIKDEFLYTVTHELRTPLTAIRSQAELVQSIPDMELEDRQRFLDAMVRECERLSKLITNVLDLEKFESGSQKLTLSKERVENVVDWSVESVQELIRKKGISLKVDLSKDIPSIFMDHTRIQQVIINLLSNAVKYVEEGKGQITITGYVLDNNIKINVADNGIGIPHEDQAQIFDKFYQARNQTRLKPKGTGLGLAICKNIIQMHKGEIWVESNQSGGTRVCFTLPIYSHKIIPS